MKWTVIWTIVLLGICTGCEQQKPALPQPGVSYELARQRKEMIKELRYQLAFRIPEQKTEAVTGQVEVLFVLDAPQSVTLDFREKAENVKKVEANGKEIQPQVVNEHILIPEQALKTGENRVKIGFIAGDQSLNRNDEYLYTLLVPDRARTLFPCFDQPDLKARFSLELEIPKNWVAVANGPIHKEQQEKQRRKITFEETQLLPTYLFSFVAGRWEQVQETRDGRTVGLYHRETDTVKLPQTKVIFDQVFAALKWMEDYTGIPYPFAKYDLVLVPGFQFGGMEHPGAVLYNDKRMFLSEHPTIAEELNRMELISHETTHMWFGDDVTMAWFNDVWTKEVFANYFASRITEPQFPQVNHRLNSLRSFYPAAYSEDRTQGTNAIRQPLENLNQAGLIYGQIVYNKAPVVMEKLVELMGDDAFRQGIREYLHTYAYSNATWNGLIGILDRYTPEDLTAWSHAWVDEKGMPEITSRVEGNELVITQKDNWGRGLVWPQKIQMGIFSKPMDGRSCYLVDTVSVNLKDSVVRVKLPVKAEYVILNWDGRGYGYFVMDSTTAAFCLEQLNISKDPVTRLAVIISLYENRLNGRIAPDRFTEALLKHLETEQEPLIFLTAMGYVQETCMHKQMGKYPETEKQLLRLAKILPARECQLAAFRALLEVWTLPATTQEIFRIWESRRAFKGLTLSERDEMKMAYELALRLPEQAHEIIDRQAGRITNPDRKREFTFVARAVVPEKAALDSLFQSLQKVENRKIEPWATQVMSYLNHPLRQQQALPYILPALESLQDVQRTGDIFFPRNWIAACLRGHSGSEAAQIVRQFLQNHPDYPPLLKNKILQSAGHLER